MSVRIAIRTMLRHLGIAAVCIVAPRNISAAPPPATAPNILIILTDDQGRGDYSAFGTKDIRTPNMDRLFREGMTFQNFFANSCLCSPSRAALLTGCYPDRVGVPGVIREETPDDSWGYLSPGAKLLPQLLKPAGCHTAIISDRAPGFRHRQSARHPRPQRPGHQYDGHFYL